MELKGAQLCFKHLQEKEIPIKVFASDQHKGVLLNGLENHSLQQPTILISGTLQKISQKRCLLPASRRDAN